MSTSQYTSWFLIVSYMMIEDKFNAVLHVTAHISSCDCLITHDNTKSQKNQRTACGRLWRIASFTSPYSFERNHSRLNSSSQYGGFLQSVGPPCCLSLGFLMCSFEQVTSSYQSKARKSRGLINGLWKVLWNFDEFCKILWHFIGVLLNL